jgi:hypothetical protein
MLAAAAIIIAIGAWSAVWLRNRTAAGQPAGPGAALAVASASDASILEIGLSEHVHCALDLGFADKQFTDQAMSESLGPDYAGLLSLVKDRIPAGMVVSVAHRCKYDDRQFVHLILRDGQTVLSLLITRKHGESFSRGSRPQSLEPSGARLYVASRQAMQVTGFESQYYLVFVVSNLGESDNIRIASHLAPALGDFLSRQQV